jgi:hypothetical protein
MLELGSASAMRTKLVLSMLAAVVCVLGLQSSAKADIYLQLSDNSGGNTGILTNNGTLITYSGVVGNFNIVLTAVSSDNSNAGSTLNITNLVVSLASNATLVSGGDVLTINGASTNYSLPVGPTLNLASSGTATFVNSNQGDSMTYQSFLNTSNTSTFGAGTSSASATLTSGGGSGSQATPTSNVTVTGRSGDYAMSSKTTITIVSLGNSQIDTTGGATATAVTVPEPSTLAIAGLGGLGMLGFGLRRRKAIGA